MVNPNKQAGFTLVELMIVIAIVATIASIAIPFYMSNLREGELGAAEMNLSSLRVYLEDHRLENGSYTGAAGVWKADGSDRSLGNVLGDWTPDGDAGKYDYTVTSSAPDTYEILIEDVTSDIWLRCEDRMDNCCSPDTAGATRANCP